MLGKSVLSIAVLTAGLVASSAFAEVCEVNVRLKKEFNNPANMGYKVANVGNILSKLERRNDVSLKNAHVLGLTLEVQADTHLIMAWKDVSGLNQNSGAAISVRPGIRTYKINDVHWKNMVITDLGRGNNVLPEDIDVNATGSGVVMGAILTLDADRNDCDILSGRGTVIVDPRPETNAGPKNIVIAYSDDYCRNVITELQPRSNCGLLGSVYNARNVWSVSVNGKCSDTPDQSFQNLCAPLSDLSRDQIAVGGVEIFSDDYCRKPLASVDGRTNCSALGTVLNGGRVWSMKLDSHCINVADTSMNPRTCMDYKEAVISRETAPRDSRDERIELFSDDYCRSALTSVQYGDNCQALSKLLGNERVWSIKFQGRCENITDTNFSNACVNYTR
ncbi:MAG TPA: hypothetical protein VNJ01_01200 [Bacteriovoracaceae bacterium]|nr:hypothetical protein [Bacteriovoracaceae bacterium]